MIKKQRTGSIFSFIYRLKTVYDVFSSRYLLQVLSECKETAAKKRRQSTRLENLGIPEEELLRQQQELFAKARQAADIQEQQLAAAAFNTPPAAAFSTNS